MLLLFRPSGSASSLAELDSRVLTVCPFTAATTTSYKSMNTAHNLQRIMFEEAALTNDIVKYWQAKMHDKGCSMVHAGEQSCEYTVSVHHSWRPRLCLRHLLRTQPGWMAQPQMARSQMRASAAAQMAAQRLQLGQLRRTACSASTDHCASGAAEQSMMQLL